MQTLRPKVSQDPNQKQIQDFQDGFLSGLLQIGISITRSLILKKALDHHVLHYTESSFSWKNPWYSQYRFPLSLHSSISLFSPSLQSVVQFNFDPVEAPLRVYTGRSLIYASYAGPGSPHVISCRALFTNPLALRCNTNERHIYNGPPGLDLRGPGHPIKH